MKDAYEKYDDLLGYPLNFLGRPETRCNYLWRAGYDTIEGMTYKEPISRLWAAHTKMFVKNPKQKKSLFLPTLSP